MGISPSVRTTCTGVEMFRKLLDEGRAGENVGVLLRGIAQADLARGQVIATPGSVRAYSKFEAEVYVTTEEEVRGEGGVHRSSCQLGFPTCLQGNRHTASLADNFEGKFTLRTAVLSGTVSVAEAVMPGDHKTVAVQLAAPVAMRVGLHFTISDGDFPIGVGIVCNVVE